MTLTGKVLLVSDPHQGRMAEELIRRRLSGATLVTAIWDRGTPKTDVRRTIREGGPWDAMFSFNNDLVFQPEDLAAFTRVHVRNNGSSRDLPRAFNVHPALVRGMGYGTTPLYEDFPTHGAAAHYMEDTVDTGPIFDAIEIPLPGHLDYRTFRLRTQLVALALLDRLLARLTAHPDWDTAHAEIAALPEQLQRPWPDRYVGVPERDAALERLRKTNPGHRVFQGMPMEDGVLLRGRPANITVLPESFADLDKLFAAHGVN